MYLYHQKLIKRPQQKFHYKIQEKKYRKVINMSEIFVFSDVEKWFDNLPSPTLTSTASSKGFFTPLPLSASNEQSEVAIYFDY